MARTHVYVTLNGVRQLVELDRDDRDDAVADEFGTAQDVERRMGTRLDDPAKRGRRNRGTHPGWAHVEDVRSAYVLAGYGFGIRVLAATRERTRAHYGAPYRDLTRAPRRRSA